MYAFMMLSAAAFSLASPVDQAATTAIRPLPGPSRPVADTRLDESWAQDQWIKPLNLDLPYVAEGAQLRVRLLRLRLKVPI